MIPETGPRGILDAGYTYDKESLVGEGVTYKTESSREALSRS